MATLNSIVRQLNHAFPHMIKGTYSDDIRIEKLQYLLADSVDDFKGEELTLYIGEYSQSSHLIGRGVFLFLNVPQDARGDEQTILIRDAIDPPALCNVIQNVLYDSHLANMRKEDMFHILQAGYGIQAILDAARTILDNPLTMCTTSFSVLAISPRDDSHEVMEYIDGKYYFRRQAIQNMHQNKVMERLYNSTTPFTAGFDDTPETEFLFCGVRIQRAVIGYLCVRRVKRPFTDEDYPFLSDVAKMISIEMQKDNFYNHQSGLAYEYFLRDLLEQNIETADFAFHRMEQLGRPAAPYFWVMAFTFTQDNGRKLNAKYYIDQLISLFRTGICCFYNGNLILLLTSVHSHPFKGIDMAKFYHFLHLNQMRAGISYRYEQILQTSLYYQQAIFQLSNPDFKEDEPLSFFTDHYHHHLFHATASQYKLRSLLHPDILFLQDYDHAHGTDYIDTLRAYFKNNRNALKASKALHIHKSTFFYRLGKIESLTEFDPESCTLLFAYEFSFSLLDYLSIYY